MSTDEDVKRSIRFSMAAGEMAGDMTAYIIITLDRKGFAHLNADCSKLMEFTFMEKALQDFVLKKLNGEIIK